jgi:hypothetical protein
MYSEGSNKEKQSARKAKTKTPAHETRQTERKPKAKESMSTSSIGRVVTEEQYRARVSQKAYELYEKRQAATQLDDWLEAERLVKRELLAEGQWAGTV